MPPIFTVDSLVVPYGLDLTASENRPSAEINVSEILINARDFNVAASMLEASGVTEELTQYQRGAGITVFVPTDEAFAELPKTERLQSLPAEKKAAVLRFHVLHSYYPLGSLESIVNPVQPTLATEDTGAGRFTLNISRVNGSVAIDTGVVQASITRTVYDQNPVSVFAVSRVLLPREIFRGGGNGGTATDLVTTPPPEAAAFAPGGSPEVATPAARTTSTQGQSNDAKSSARKSAASFLLHGGGILLYCSVEILHLLLVSNLQLRSDRRGGAGTPSKVRTGNGKKSRDCPLTGDAAAPVPMPFNMTAIVAGYRCPACHLGLGLGLQ
ncbi:unnamed protein product [Spirodela intermedia]|uniref:FAS1 domain-containing protein n=1 Tax=Spirodela intermedia TaxID=51605 RepID=A0A7I8IBK6_SPIIN|nr:unnamed protein product [Spirodela intermedia]CAA6654968.1 unnamed protein product [Spirodela intermedia]